MLFRMLDTKPIQIHVLHSNNKHIKENPNRTKEKHYTTQNNSTSLHKRKKHLLAPKFSYVYRSSTESFLESYSVSTHIKKMQWGKGRYEEIWTLPKFYSWRLDRIIRQIHHPAIICNFSDVLPLMQLSLLWSWLKRSCSWSAIWPYVHPVICPLEMWCFFSATSSSGLDATSLASTWWSGLATRSPSFVSSLFSHSVDYRRQHTSIAKRYRKN